MLKLNSLSKQIGFGYVLVLSVFILSLVIALNELKFIEGSSQKIKSLINPTIKSSLMLLNGVNHSLVVLKGWVLIGSDDEGEIFRKEKEVVWREEINNSLDELTLLSTQWTNTESIRYLSLIRRSLDKLEEYQDQIFIIRNAESGDKAKYIFKSRATPLALEIKETIKLLLENQYKLQTEEYNKEQKQLERLRWLLIFFLLIGSLGSIFVGFTFIKKVKAPLNDLIEIIKGMSKGQFNLHFKGSHIIEVQHLSESVQIMKENFLQQNMVLENEKIRLEEEDWVKSSLNSILENLPRHVDIYSFSNDLLNSLVPKVDGLVGVFYSKKTRNLSKEVNLSRAGSYAYSFSESINFETIALGEGLIGQCALTLKTMYISDVADHHTLINSTFIKSKYNHIVLLPIAFEGEVLGVIEIGSMKKYSNIHRSLFEQIVNNTGVMLKAVLGRFETEKLLGSLNAQNKELNAHTLDLIEAKKLTESANNDLAAQKAAIDQHSLVSVTNVKGIITYANDRFCTVSGYSREELVGKNHNILNSNNQPKSYWQAMFQKVSKGQIWHDEVCNRTKDDKPYWVDTTIVPLYDRNNSLTGYTSIRTDITHQKEIISHLAEAKKQAEVANDSKTNFLANMSHEIRTPMNGVIGMTNLLLDTSLNQDQRDFAKTVKNSAESLLTIINDILDFSKVEAGMLELEPIEFDLGLLLHDLGSALVFRAHDKELELICPANIIPCQLFIADSGRIRQILNNLIGNAIKFTSQGEVSVYCKVQEKTEQHTQLLFEIKDTGIGLTEEKQNKLFERFIQADDTTTRKYGGTGLGLAISKQLVELMDGEIGVKSNERDGSTFWFTLKLGNAKNQLPLKTFDHIQEQKVLVVDDNLTNRTLMGQLLTNWKVEYMLVESGLRALEELNKAVAEGKPYHVAILDMEMPQMNGLQLGNAIKSNSRLSQTQLVILASQGKRGDSDRLRTAGFNGYLSKPVDQTILYNTLLKIVGASEETLITEYSPRELPQFTAKVLVVEDNAINQKVAQGLLKKYGIQADLVANGEEALSALERLPYDLVFMDCQMPIMDGYEASRRIRDLNSKVLDRAISIVAMTANTMQGDREKCITAGMNDFISKPVDPNKLQEALKLWLPECVST